MSLRTKRNFAIATLGCNEQALDQLYKNVILPQWIFFLNKQEIFL
jgi:hypothetical protein